MIDLEELANSLSSILVARSEIGEFTQGLYKTSSFNTFDGSKKDIKGKIKKIRKLRI